MKMFNYNFELSSVNYFSRYSEISERNILEIYVLGHEFAVIYFVRERQEIGKKFNYKCVDNFCS